MSGGSHAVPALGRVHYRLAAGRLAAQRAAQLADEPLAVEEHGLADQRRAVAVDAAAAAGGQPAQALAHERDLEHLAGAWTGVGRQADEGFPNRGGGHAPALREVGVRTSRCKALTRWGSPTRHAGPMLRGGGVARPREELS